MRLLPDDGELTEVLVEGENNLALACRVLQDGGIARIGGPVTDALDVVPGIT